ncbi:MAG TPA: hypothetical protein VF585_03345 [Chthoniobacterales bacterium]|jgi:hypothetical protein
MPILVCKRVLFYSHGDEVAFLGFANSITAVKSVEEVSDCILLHVSSRPSQQSLRDLIGLFTRYRISEVSQLVVFLNDSNRAWFPDPRKFWYRRVFGSSSSSNT